MFVQAELFVELRFVKVNQLVIVIFVIQTLLTQVMSFQVNLLVQTIFVSLIHHYRLNRYHLYILLSLLAFSVYYRYNIFKMNIRINLFLVIMILLTKSTCFGKFFILYISRSSTFSRSNLNTYIAFQSFRTILQLNTSEISFFYKGLCIFAILSINSLNFPESNVQIIFIQNIFKKIGNVLQIFIFIFFVPVIWQFNAFCITVLLR